MNTIQNSYVKIEMESERLFNLSNVWLWNVKFLGNIGKGVVREASFNYVNFKEMEHFLDAVFSISFGVV
jgi:hypothetical protein